jgi:hypothetical protein
MLQGRFESPSTPTKPSKQLKKNRSERNRNRNRKETGSRKNERKKKKRTHLPQVNGVEEQGFRLILSQDTGTLQSIALMDDSAMVTA